MTKRGVVVGISDYSEIALSGKSSPHRCVAHADSAMSCVFRHSASPLAVTSTAFADALRNTRGMLEHENGWKE